MPRTDTYSIEVTISGDSLLLNTEPGMPETVCMAEINHALHNFFMSAPVGLLLGGRTVRCRIESYAKAEDVRVIGIADPPRDYEAAREELGLPLPSPLIPESEQDFERGVR